MWKPLLRKAAPLMTLALSAVPSAFAQNVSGEPLRATITVDAAAEGKPIPATLYGVFFEDINFGADGGLYAELVQNRSFEYYPFRPVSMETAPDSMAYNAMTAWSTVGADGVKVHAGVTADRPLNVNNPHYVFLTLDGPPGAQAGLANAGYDGFTVENGAIYTASLFARWGSRGAAGPLRVALETDDGRVVAEATLPAPTQEWTRYAATLTPTRSADKLRLVVTTAARGGVCLDMISLMPTDTFKGRANGLRKDLAQAIADLHPKTLRFPGGCIVHGDGLDQAYRWKDTVGPVEGRRGNSNRWGYHQTYGLGYFEYFQFAEDIGAAPLPILPVAVSCGFEPPYEACRPADLHEWVQDVVDLVEFANGPVDSTWGKVRADMGHPAPFNLKYVGLGNEEHDTALFRGYYPAFVKALREAHPEITIVGTSGLGTGIPIYGFMRDLGVDLSDEHYYEPPEWFIANRDRFDKFPRGGPKVYVGEYASRGNTLFNALAEATYLSGVERNADVVAMTAYAPLLARYGHTQWTAANLIHFDDKRVVLTPNYHVQQLFSTNVGSRSLPSGVKFAGDGEPPVVAVSASADDAGTIYLKVVNPTASAVAATIKLGGVAVAPEAERVLLTGDRGATNTRETPDAVAPETSSVRVGDRFELPLPAMSLQVLRLRRR